MFSFSRAFFWANHLVKAGVKVWISEEREVPVEWVYVTILVDFLSVSYWFSIKEQPISHCVHLFSVIHDYICTVKCCYLKGNLFATKAGNFFCLLPTGENKKQTKKPHTKPDFCIQRHNCAFVWQRKVKNIQNNF